VIGCERCVAESEVLPFELLLGNRLGVQTGHFDLSSTTDWRSNRKDEHP
jgi:hypothetical protein